MTQGLREITVQTLNEALEGVLLPHLMAILKTRADGHCMKVSDLDTELMARLALRLRAEVPAAQIVMLDDGRLGLPPAVRVSSTKLVELRNPLPNGELRPPLLVFVPTEIRASAEDSFGSATFEEIRLDGVYAELRQRLLDEVPIGLRDAVLETVRQVFGGQTAWPFADSLSVVRFLLTGKVNGWDAEAIGAALFELGLVPDFELYVKPERVTGRLLRNRECVEKLTWSARSERARALELGLTDAALKKRLGEFFATVGLDDPRRWGRLIVVDRSLWPLSFDKWPFEDGGSNPDTIFIGEVTLDLPVVSESETDPRLSELVGQKVLAVGKGGARKFNASFLVDPTPSRVSGLTRFVAQVVSRDNGPVGLVRRKSAWKGAAEKATISFPSLNKVEWEEGWHFVRILAETEDGGLVPLVDENGKDIPWHGDPASGVFLPNESDVFYVVADSEVEVEATQRAVPREPSLAHARFKAQFSAVLNERDPKAVAVTEVTWTEAKSGSRATGSTALEIKLGREGIVHVPVSRVLLDIERKILAAPDGPLTWRLPVNQGLAGSTTADIAEWPTGEVAGRFLAARRAYFEAVRHGGHDFILQAHDPAVLQDKALDYASAYSELISDLLLRAESGNGLEGPGAMRQLRGVLGVDAITIVLTDYRGRCREAVLLAPTHPLRALWFATWAALGRHWLDEAKRAPKEFITPTRDALLQQLSPAGFPPVLPTEGAHVLTAVDNIHPFWTLYAPTHEVDPRGLLGDVCAALSLPEPAIGGALIDGRYLASRAQRFLVQHPYVETLTINAFNAGRAKMLADMLLTLQSEAAFADLRYDIRLFVPDPDAPGVGESLLGLLSPEGGSSAAEADAFSIPTESHLRPKLRLAIRDTREFRESPDAHPAHLTLLFDVFPAEDVGVAPADVRDGCAHVHGLIQDYATDYREEERCVTWRKRPRHGVARPIDAAEELSPLLSSLSSSLSSATATIATNQTGGNLRPVVTLSLDADERALLHQIHEVSDWVLTIDRNLGIEFFDHGRSHTRPDYLIDHSPDIANAQGHRLVITSRSVAELEAMLRSVLGSYGLRSTDGQAIVILDQLRSLSGRLALKLISSPTQQSEALGLALSRLYLEHQGVFENQIVVPLDAHIDLYRSLQKGADELGDEVSFKRTDLALFDLDASRRLITCRLVEVKCYKQVGDIASYNQLRTSIAEQIVQSEQVLAYHFDPHRTPVDRPDRAMKTRDFAALLEFYLSRSERYRLVAPEVADEGRYFLRTLERDGYRLVFTRSALVFDFAKAGTEPPEIEDGIEFHRLGQDLIQQLIDAAVPETMASATQTGMVSAIVPSGTELLRLRRERAPSIPTLATAAFLGAPRDRTVSWEVGQSATSTDHSLYPSLPANKPTVPPDPGPAATDSAASTYLRCECVQEDEVDSPSVKDTTQQEIVNATEAPSEQEPGVGEATSQTSSTPLATDVVYDVMIGVSGGSPQYGLLGEIAGRKVGIDLNQTHTISLFGVQGGGKSYTLGTVVEMASMAIPGVNRLPQPLATVIFHYSPTMDYRPEFTSMVSGNSDEEQIAALRERYGAEPKALSDVVLLAPADKVEERREEYPGIEVLPLKFASSELQSSHWRFLMGAVGNQATYIRQLNRIMRALRADMTLDSLRNGIDTSGLPDHLKELARMRLELAAEYIDDSTRLGEIIHPGRLIIVDLRDEFIEKDEALGLFVVLLQLFADAKYEGRSFNKLVVFDEAHKYIESPDLVAGLVEVVREMRHKGTSIMVASQDPPSVPISLIELSSQIILHKFNSPAWLKHIQKANAALASLSPERMASLRPGEAFLWSSKASDEAFTRSAQKIRCRPRVTEHGGATKTAVSHEPA